MTPEEIQAMAKGLAEGQALGYVLSAVAGGVAAYFGAYLAERGKNRATKEDIRFITQEVEEAKDVFQRGLSDLNAHHQLRMIAAERRIQAHQEAYTLYCELLDAMQESEEGWSEIYSRTKDWYKKNNLYLGPETRLAFMVSIQGCERYRILRATADRTVLDEIRKEEIQRIFPILFHEVQLPSISERSNPL
jgi:hypothetical protein